MTDPVFRPDIQDALLRLLFDKHRINLLKVPREDLQPGQALLLAGSGAVPDAFGPVALQNLVPGLVLPEVARDARLADVDATFSDSQEGRVEGGIFASFLERFWPGATLPSISAKAEASGGRKLFLRFSKATRDGIDFAALGRALGPNAPDLSFVEGAEAVRIFAVVDVYRCPEIEMSWTDDKGRVIDAEAVVAEAAKLGLGHKVRKEAGGLVKVAGDSALAFGVRLMELVRRDDGPGLRLRLAHTRIDVLGGGPRDGGTAEADARDYRLLADPWAGGLGIGIRPPA
jgi:hypothetical protein